ncbi:MAG: Coenzyme F420 hydrogenase/dehydrogenase, beta subunit C-terminal domain [Pseudomonadota bacterium]
MTTSDQTSTADSELNPEMRKRSLRIIPQDESAPTLRAGGSFVTPLDWNSDRDTTTPRALRSLGKIVDGGLCHRCGSCVGICPTGVLGLDSEDYPSVVKLSACTDCDLCVKVCPGDEFDIHQAYREVYNEEAELSSTHGHFTHAYLSYATDPLIRERSTSGGLVTAILLDQLRTGAIDGAIVITSDENQLWKGKPIVARTEQEILGAMKSKYAICPTNSVFHEIREIPGRYALVGLPCQIHGFVKAARLDQRLRERVVLTLGLFCHAAVEHEALKIIWSSLGDKVRGATRYISRVGKHPGTPHLEMQDGSLYPVYFGQKRGYRPSSMEIINIVYRLYTPARCLTCFDASAEFADIAVGDPWMAPPHSGIDFYKGWSFALVRSARGHEAIQKCLERGGIVNEPVTRREALACNRMMSTEKRWRAFRVIETLRRQGKPIPAYGPHGFRFPKQSGKQFLKTEIHMFTHMFCHLPKLRGAVLKCTLSNFGYILLWLNSQRRSLRFLVRDSWSRLRNAIVGRR